MNLNINYTRNYFVQNESGEALIAALPVPEEMATVFFIALVILLEKIIM